MSSRFLSKAKRNFYALFLAAVASTALPSLGQDFSVVPELKLAGPKGQLVYVIVRYHDRNKPVRTVHMRLKVGSPTKRLEFGHTATSVTMFVPSKRAVTATMLNGEDVLAQTTAAGNNYASMQHGDVDDNYQPPRFKLNDRERVFATHILEAVSKADVRGSVASTGMENIQWQTLNAYFQSLRHHLGKPIIDAELDGWLSWDGRLGTRVLAGDLGFEKGSCALQLIYSGDKLLDVLVDCPQMPGEWFQGPSDIEEYEGEAAELIRLVFSRETDSAERARGCFAGRYQESTTLARVQELQRNLQEEYGTEIKQIQLLDSFLAPYSEDAERRKWDLFQLVDFGKKQCIAQTTFEFTSRANFVGQGGLASVNFRPSWPSVAPRQAEVVKEFLEECRKGKVDLAWFHSSLEGLLDAPKLQLRFGEIAGRFAPWKMPTLATWTSNGEGDFAFASGKLRTEQGAIDAQFDFIGDRLLGVTFTTQDSAWTTLGCIRDPNAPGRVAHSFWSRIFSSDIYDAHSHLQESFKEQLPRQRLEQVVQESGFSESSLRRLKVLDQVLTQRIDRSFPATVSVYLVASFQDDSQQTLRCELIPVEDRWKVVDFSSDFSARLMSTSGFPEMDLLRQGLQASDSEALVEMMTPALREAVESPLLDAFLKHLSEIEEFSEPLDSTVPLIQKNMVEYFNGRRFESGVTRLERSKSQAELRATFEFGKLMGLVVSDSRVEGWSLQVEPDYFERRAETIVRKWLNEGERGLLPYLSFALRQQETTGPRKAELAATAGGWTLSLGDLDSVTSEGVKMGQQTAEVLLDLEFANGSEKLQVGFQFDIFTSRISSIQVAD